MDLSGARGGQSSTQVPSDPATILILVGFPSQLSGPASLSEGSPQAAKAGVAENFHSSRCSWHKYSRVFATN